MQPEVAPPRDRLHEGVMGLPDRFGQFFDIAAGQFCINAGTPGILQLDFDHLKVNHGIPFLNSAERGVARQPISDIVNSLA